MPTELLIAPPATGKTHACIDRIQAARRTNPLARIRVLVPDRFQAAAFRQRLAEAGGALGVDVGRFDDLYHAILDQAGIFIPLASEPLLQRVIVEIIDQAVAQGRLPYLAPLQQFPGFIQSLRGIFAELKRSLITPDQFSAAVISGSKTHQELGVLYALYQSRLDEIQWADPEDYILRAINALQSHPDLFSQTEFLVVDGFDTFTIAQMEVLRLLTPRITNLLITLPGAPGSKRPAHHRFQDDALRLIQALSPVVTTLANPPRLPADLTYVERHLFEPQLQVASTFDQPILLEARSPAEEAREALRWLKMRIVRDGVAPSTCAIFTPNPRTYHPLLRAAATEFGIPLRFTLDESLGSSPVIAVLLNLLSLPGQHFNSRRLLNVLRSPYFDFGMSAETVDILEVVSRVAQIVEGQDQWREAWDQLAASTTEERMNLDDERNAPALPRGEEVKPYRHALAAVFEVITPSGAPQSLTDWINWLESLLEHLGFYEEIKSESEIAACEVLQEVLRALILSEVVAGDRRMTFDQFLSDLQSTLNTENYREPVVSNLPTVLVGRMSEARGTRYQAVVLLGLSEGSFPVVEHADPFLDEGLRAQLGLDSWLGREQAGLFYQAVTRADQYLLITRPYLTDDGEEWEKSAYWMAVESLFGEKSSISVKVSPDAPHPLADAASPQELLFSAVRRKSLPQKYADFESRWRQLQHAQSVLRARRAKQPEGVYEGKPEVLAETLTQRYSADTPWSASRLETYGNCPFRFYVSSALELAARAIPELGMNAAQLGNMLHTILELTFKNAGNPNDIDSVLAALRVEANRAFATAPQHYGFRPSALWGVEKAQFLKVLEATVTALVGDADWTPIAFEQWFGKHGSPPLVVEVGREIIQIHGVIDRVDRNLEGDLRVMDYKTGSAHHSADDLRRGYSLQLPLYALAAEQTLNLGHAVDGLYWQINAGKAGPLKLAKFKSGELTGIEAAYEALYQHLERIVHGIHAAQFPPRPPKGGCPEFCPAALWCWRYEAGRQS